MNTRKMTGKQQVVGGFNLDSFVGGADQPEKGTTRDAVASSKPKKAQKRAMPSVAALKPSTASSKPSKEMLSERVQFKITPSEMRALQEKTGMIPVSAYLRKLLQDSGVI